MKEPRKPVSARIEYLGRTPRTFELPIPFVQKCEKTGEVKCDPVGTFPIDDAERLLAISGADGLFRLVEYVYEDKNEEPEEKALEANDSVEKQTDPICKCGCGEKIVVKPQHKYSGIPKYIPGHFQRQKKSAVPVIAGG